LLQIAKIILNMQSEESKIPPQETDKSMLFITEAVKTAKMIGTKNTIHAVIAARQPHIDRLNKQLFDLIKKEICECFNVTLYEIDKGRKKGNRREALMVGYALARKHLDCSLSTIAMMFDKDVSNMSKLITVFNKLDCNNKQDKVIIAHFDRINKNIAEFKNKNNAWQAEIN
jgi:hypothetical protein